MNREMRRKDRELSYDETIEILKSCSYGILSTVNEEGQPYGVPISYVFLNNSIYFHCAGEGHKLDNMKKNNKVSFCVVGNISVVQDKFTTKYESAIVFGRTEEVFENEKNEALLEIIKKYSPDFIDKGREYIERAGKATTVIKISIEHASGKANK